MQLWPTDGKAKLRSQNRTGSAEREDEDECVLGLLQFSR